MRHGKNKRRILEKFVFGRKVSAGRRKRAEARIEGKRSYANAIFGGAETLLKIENPKESRLVFVGQAMRPLFEAVRGINEFEQVFPRRNIRYFVAPDGSFSFKNSVERQKIVSNKMQRYYVIDFTSNEGEFGTFSKIKKAIKKNQSKRRSN
jgi:hypothetical protein